MVRVIARTFLGSVLTLAFSAFPGDVAASSIHWSTDGSRMVAVYGSEVSLFDAQGVQTKKLTLEQPANVSALSPDGTKLAYTTNGAARILDLDDGTDVKVATVGPPLEFFQSLRWAPGNIWLSFEVVRMEVTTGPTGMKTKEVRLYRVKADGTEKKLLISYIP